MEEWVQKRKSKSHREDTSHDDRKQNKRDMSMTDLKVEGSSTEWKKEAKYVGVVIDRKLTWKIYIKETINKAKSRITRVKTVMGTRSTLHL